MLNLKSYLYGGLAILILLAIGYVYFLKESRDKYQDKAIYEQSEKEKSIATVNKMIQDNQKAESNRATYLSELEQSENERKRLEKCIADKSCIATIRVFVKSSTTCTAASAPNTSGTETAMAELDSDSRRAYTNIRAGIETLESKYRLCQVTLQDWSN